MTPTITYSYGHINRNIVFLKSIFSWARRAAKRSPILIWERKGNPLMNLLMVIMASGLAHGHVRTTTTTTTTTESHKMAAMLQVIGWQRHAALVYRLLLWYWTSMLRSMTPVKTRYLVTSIRWPYRGLKCAARRGHVFLKLTADQVLVFDWIAGSCHVNLLKSRQDCSEAC